MNRFLRDAMVSGAVASLASSVALAALGRVQLDSAATPFNGPSQWIWGRHAPYRNGFSIPHSVVGYAVHHAASTFWALVFEATRRAVPNDIAAAAATTAVAGVVDFGLSPQRMRPGFQKRLSPGAVTLVYLAFAAGLAVHGALRRR